MKMVQQGWYSDPSGQAEFRWWDGQQWTCWTHPPRAETAANNVHPTEAVDLSGLRHQGGLAALLGQAERIAVIDVETTGLYTADRVVEVGVVTLDRGGTIVDEFECLINPLRDPGPTHIHGLTPSILRDAPLFGDVALHLAALLDGAVVAAHNLAFDRRLLTSEFHRAGVTIDWGDGLDTLRAVGCKLPIACAEYGIDLHGAHCALNDARATAQLLLEIVESFQGCRPATAHPLSADPPRIRTRDGYAAADIDRPYVVHLARGMHTATDIAPYVDLLDHALADLKIEDAERNELALLADDLGLDDHMRARAHKDFLDGLIDAALDDGAVTDDEFEMLSRVAALLDIEDAVVSSRTDPHRITTETLRLSPGLPVCFTGAAQGPDGTPLERGALEHHARRHGLQTVDAVTKKNCALLVAADPASMSGKAKNAQKFGIPVASVPDFLAALASGSELTVRRLPAKGVGLVCTRCGHSWIAVRRMSNPVCDDCLPPAATSPAACGTGNWRNAKAFLAREERLDRCRKAVALQRAGLTRAEIGKRLGVGKETVATLLRDGKFYTNPNSDPPRLALAQDALAAQGRALTREQFRIERRVSKSKADEAWRDADGLFGEGGTLRAILPDSGS